MIEIHRKDYSTGTIDSKEEMLALIDHLTSHRAGPNTASEVKNALRRSHVATWPDADPQPEA